MYPDTIQCIQIQKGVKKIATKSRADYFKERRKTRKDFGVLIDRNKLETLENKLKEQNKTKTTWLNEKIDEEIGK